MATKPTKVDQSSNVSQFTTTCSPPPPGCQRNVVRSTISRL